MSDPNLPPPPGGTPPPPPGGGAPPPPPPAGGAPPPPGPPPDAGGYGGGYQPPPAQPYGGGGVPRLEVGAAFSYGWEKFQQYAKEFIILVLAVWLAIIVVSLVAFIVLLPAIGTDSTILWILGVSIATFLVLAVSFIVQAGVYRAALAVTRGEAPSTSMLTDTTNIGPYILTVVVVALGTSVGYFLCIIPGLIFLVICAYAPFLAVDRGYGPGDAISTSYKMVKENLGPVLLILLVAYVVYYIGALLCGVGLLVSIPVAITMLSYSYRAILQEPVAP